MEPIQPGAVATAVAKLQNKPVFIHLEVNPGAYWRNGQAALRSLHLKGEDPYRVFLELDEGHGLIQVNDVTHMELSDSMVILTGYDDKGRIAQTVEISLSPLTL